MGKLNLELLAWVARGSRRRTIIRFIDGRKIPTQIYESAKRADSKISRNGVSDTLKEFVEMKLAVCVNPSQRTGRIYKLTPNGELVKKELMKSD